MIKLALIGLWVCAVTVAAGFFGTRWQPEGAQQGEHAKAEVAKMAQVKVRPLSIPIVRDGAVAGYVSCQLTYLLPSDRLKKLAVKPDTFILDAAFQGIYSGKHLDVTALSKDAWAGLGKAVKDTVNARYGMEVVHEIVIEEFGFVPANEVRKDPLSVKGAAAAAAPRGSPAQPAKAAPRH